MRKYLRVIALFVATATTLGAAGCGPEVTVTNVVHAPTPTFARYHAFVVEPSDETPEAFRASDRATQVRKEMLPLVTAQLQKKGYTLSTSATDADLIVRVSCGTRVQQRPRHRDGTGEESVPDDTILVDLVVDGFDAKSKERTWHSEGRVDTDLGQATTSDVPAAVRSLLEEFPSAPGATASR